MEMHTKNMSRSHCTNMQAPKINFIARVAKRVHESWHENIIYAS